MRAISTQNIALFSGLSEPELAGILLQATVREVPRKANIFLHGDEVRRFMVIAGGDVQLFRQLPDGHEKTIEILTVGQSIGTSEVMDSCRLYRANARAVSDCTLIDLPASSLKELARTYSTFALNLLSEASARAHMAQLEAEHKASMSAPQLIACFLQRLCVVYGFDPKGYDLPYSKTLIASRLGLEIETFSRSLTKLRENGIVVEGKQVRIENPELVNTYVCETCSISGECMTQQKLEGLFQSQLHHNSNHR